jgi:hypothetical protein
LVPIWRRVGTEQDHAADVQASVYDFVPPFRWHLLCHGRLAKGHDRFDFSSETFFVKLESGLALAVE